MKSSGWGSWKYFAYEVVNVACLYVSWRRWASKWCSWTIGSAEIVRDTSWLRDCLNKTYLTTTMHHDSSLIPLSPALSRWQYIPSGIYWSCFCLNSFNLKPVRSIQVLMLHQLVLQLQLFNVVLNCTYMLWPADGSCVPLRVPLQLHQSDEDTRA